MIFSNRQLDSMTTHLNASISFIAGTEQKVASQLMCNPGKTGSRRKQEVLLDATTRNVTSSADPLLRCNKNQDESK